jgi:clathrin heavy chain
MHWNRQIIALSSGSSIQIFDLEQKQKLQSASMNGNILFTKWLSQTAIGIVTESAVTQLEVFDLKQPAPVELFKLSSSFSVRKKSDNTILYDHKLTR